MSNKVVSEKYGVPRNTFYVTKKERQKSLIWKSKAQILNERKRLLVDMRTLTKLYFNGSMQKRTKMYLLIRFYWRKSLGIYQAARPT